MARWTEDSYGGKALGSGLVLHLPSYQGSCFSRVVLSPDLLPVSPMRAVAGDWKWAGERSGICLPSLHLLSQQLTLLCGPSFFCKDLVRIHLPSRTLPLDAANLLVCPSTLWLLAAPSWGISCLCLCSGPSNTVATHPLPSFIMSILW